jgi:hypothetical protein
MITGQLSADLLKLYKLKKELSEKQLGRATAAAINRSLSHAVSTLKREIRHQYKAPTSTLNTFPLFKANSNKLEGFVKAKTHPLSLSHFDPRYEYGSGGSTFAIRVRTTKDGLTKTIRKKQRGQPKKGVSIEIKKGQRITIPYAFMTGNDIQKPVFARGAYKQGGSYGLVRRNKRVNKKGMDLPIAKLLTVSVYGMAVNKSVSRNTQVDLSNYLMKRLEHEMRVRVNKIVS